MNEASSDNHSSIAPTVQPNTVPVLSPAKTHFPPSSAPTAPEVEEDDSTIKCICGFKHDDGSSVFCEKCETWQHTECYYYDEENERVPTGDELDKISHFCTDCRPRSIDVQAAITRQKTRMGGFDQDDKKTKKPPAKSHKKKVKGLEANGNLTNGWSRDADGSHECTSRSPRDAVPNAKKPKAHQRSSQSLGLSALSHNPTSHPHKRSAPALQSPTRLPTKQGRDLFLKENLSDAFMHLYDDDPGDQSLHTNLFSNISITQDLSNWAFDVEALHKATRGFSHAEVFHRIEQPLESIMGPLPQKRSKEEPRVTIDGRHPRWIYLTSDGFTKKNTIVGELKGKVGHMRDYISDPDNKWDWLRHPAPFLFFHPKLPIYIDTRSEGTTCRYLRRSCRPNLSMTTFLENDSEYHFCFTAKEDIEDGAELTIGWTLDEHMRKFSSNKNDMAQDLNSDGEDYFTDWVGKVSPEFGGCACGLPKSCWFVRYDPEFRLSAKAKGGQGRRKPQPNPQDSSDADEARSTSRSNSGSRDPTPTGHESAGSALGLDISEREKRKIALLEKNLENDKHQPAAKKKKRNSGGSSANPLGPGSAPKHSPSSMSPPNTPGLLLRAQYVDASSGKKPGSPTAKGAKGIGLARPSNMIGLSKDRQSVPNTPTNPSPLRSNYKSTGVQTELGTEGDWFQPGQNPSAPRKAFMSMTKRLLLRSQRDRQIIEERRRSSEALSYQESLDVLGGADIDEKSMEQDGEDVNMPDAHQSTMTIKTEIGVPAHPPRAVSLNREPKPPPWPSRDKDVTVNGSRGIELRVQLPPKPPQPPDSTSSTPITQTPVSLIPQSSYPTFASAYSTLQPPSSSNQAQAGPAKKKISISDYMKRKGSSNSTEGKIAVGSPEMTHRTPKSPVHTSAGDAPLAGSAIMDTPKKEESNPLEAGGPEPTSASPPIQEERKSES